MTETLASDQSADWEIIKLGDAATFINGYAFKPSDWKTEGLEIIRIQNLTKSSNSVNYYDGEINSRYKVVKGDFLISWSATLGIFEWVGKDAWLNQHLFRVAFDKRKFDKSFFKHLIAMSLEEMGKETHGSTMKHITKPRFDNFKIPYPPLVEQQKISAILDAADSLRQKDQQLVEHYNALSQSLFLEMFGHPVTNPMGWDYHEFGSIGNLDRGKSKHRPRNDPELLGGDYPLIQTGDVANCDGHIKNYSSTYSEIGLMQSKMWKAGTLCITIAANIAKTGILDFDACFPDSVVGFIPNKKTNIEYVQRWLSFLQKLLEDTAPMAAQKNINLKILRELSVPLPPIELQNQFAERIQLIEAQKQQAQSSLKQSNALFNSLLQRAFTGQLTAKMAA